MVSKGHCLLCYLDGRGKITNFDIETLCTSLNEKYGDWNDRNNMPLYKKIRGLYKTKKFLWF